MKDIPLLAVIAVAFILWMVAAGPAKVGNDLGEAYRNFITAAQGNK